jgi:SAM-dependent methyltransferase
MNDALEERRARARELAEQFTEQGNMLGWFDAFYKEAGGDSSQIPWGDLEPNKFLKAWAEDVGLRGNGRKALVVGCGLGDDARYLNDLGFDVTAFDISPTAIEWAKQLSEGIGIRFLVADLFDPPSDFFVAGNPPATAGGTDKTGAFDFVLEIYTIQPLPMEMRERVIDSIAGFVADGGELVVITRGREDGEEPIELPWPLSRRDLSRFETHGLRQIDFRITEGDDPPTPRFVVQYKKAA